MNEIKFKRKHKENKPVLAICYDFDKTLSPDDMQAQGYIQSVGYNVPDFWREVNELAENNGMDQNLAYMYQMKIKAEGQVIFTKKQLQEYGRKVELFPGVKEWFKRINEYGEKRGVIVEHYIISCGLKEMIEGTQISNEFTEIYASSFLYNESGVAVWPSQVVNFTNKTQYLFRIEKGVLDINDPGVNEFFTQDKMRIPFRNMIYIGDSDTDVPCMKLVNSNGGHSIGVYNADTKDKSKVYKMLTENRIKYFVPADYSENKDLDFLIKDIIDKTAVNEKLENIYYQCYNESFEQLNSISILDRKKKDLIMTLESSSNFANTHSIISDLNEIKNWSNDDVEKLVNIAIKNVQVKYILQDSDIKQFYTSLIKNYTGSSNNITKLKEILK